ncbi:MAG: hypothetical protein JKY56_25305 [Kofleriaceae bacterium]|nr:hypothetical protein [Kofleriaceae bacterium]
MSPPTMRHRPAFTLALTSSWDGTPLLAEEYGEVKLHFGESGLHLQMRARYWQDPAPKAPAGSTSALWEHEVLELFLLGSDNRYLELEFGPHGHYLALELHGERTIVRQGFSIDYTAQIGDSEWSAEAYIPGDLLPPGLDRLNIHGIHGQGNKRRYLAWKASSDKKPDFHCLRSFGTISEASASGS